MLHLWQPCVCVLKDFYLHISLICFSHPQKEDEVIPAKFDDDLIWVAAETPLSDSGFLSNKIKDLCGDLPIFWLRPTFSSSKQTDFSVVWIFFFLKDKKTVIFSCFYKKQREYGSNSLKHSHLTSQLFKLQRERERKTGYKERKAEILLKFLSC